MGARTFFRCTDTIHLTTFLPSRLLFDLYNIHTRLSISHQFFYLPSLLIYSTSSISTAIFSYPRPFSALLIIFPRSKTAFKRRLFSLSVTVHGATISSFLILKHIVTPRYTQSKTTSQGSKCSTSTPTSFIKNLSGRKSQQE